jgi:hypothetical protein
LVKRPSGGKVDTVFTCATHFFMRFAGISSSTDWTLAVV